MKKFLIKKKKNKKKNKNKKNWKEKLREILTDLPQRRFHNSKLEIGCSDWIVIRLLFQEAGRYLEIISARPRISANRYCNGLSKQTFDNCISIKGSDLISDVAGLPPQDRLRDLPARCSPRNVYTTVAVNTLNGDELGNDPRT